MNLIHNGLVDSEDGFLLIGDAATLQSWHGSEDEQKNSALVESALRQGLPGLNIWISQQMGAIWDLEGAGTVDIFRDEASSAITIVRCWLEDSDDLEAVNAFALRTAETYTNFAKVEVKTGFIGILCPIEIGDCIRSAKGIGFSLSCQNMLSESSGMIISVENGIYECLHDAVKLGQTEARRCHLVRSLS